MGKANDDPEVFWAQYAESIGEEVLAHALGRYISGWFLEAKPLRGPLWGLLIATSGGFRFHHFPQDNWYIGLLRTTGNSTEGKELSFFLPKQQIISIEYIAERSWWQRLLSFRPPTLLINYRLPDGTATRLRTESGFEAEAVVKALMNLAACQEQP